MKGSRVYLEMFKTFADLAETQSFSTAAARNFLTQSAVSQQVAFLERRMGKKLLDRGKGRLHLTEAGQVFLETCRHIQEAYQGAIDRIHQRPEEISGLLNVETIYSIGLHGLTPYVRGFMKRYPQVNLRLVYKRSDEIYQDVLHSACDLGIVAFPVSQASLIITVYDKEPMVFVCDPGHALAKKRKIQVADLKGQAFVAFSHDVPTRQAVDRWLRRHGVFARIVHETDNVETLKRCVEIGTGVSILSQNTVLQEVKDKLLVSVPLAGGPLIRPIGILRARKRTPTRAAQEFIRWLQHRPAAPR